MADALVDVKMIGELLLLRKFAHFLVDLRRSDRGRGRVVVKYERQPVLVPDLFPVHLPEGEHGLEIQVVDLGEGHIRHDDLACAHRLPSACLRKNFFYRMHGRFPRFLSAGTPRSEAGPVILFSE